METTKTNALGSIHISDKAISSIAARTAALVPHVHALMRHWPNRQPADWDGAVYPREPKPVSAAMRRKSRCASSWKADTASPI